MSTRGHIAVKNGDLIRFVYHHSDSYLEWLGIKLLKYYNSAELANKLVNLGDMSHAGDNLRFCDSYAKQGMSYKDVAPVITKDFNTFASQEYNYCYDVQDKCWYVTMDEWATQKREKVTYKLEELIHNEPLLRELFTGYFTEDYMEEFIKSLLCA